jgi:7-cyano-7-deazaguanine synthase
MRHSADALVLLSGGVDSTTVLARVRSRGFAVITVTFDYGQTLRHELAVAAGNSERYGAVIHYEIPLDLGPAATNCALMAGSSRELPTDRTVEEINQGGTPPSYVPFRNGIFFAYLVGMGESLGIEDIYAGCNGLLSGQYYDDTMEFAAAFTEAARAGTSRNYCPEIHVPYAATDKGRIVAEGLRLGVDYSQTYSCYTNAVPHCGRCDSCQERAVAMAANGLNIEGEHVGAAIQG